MTPRKNDKIVRNIIIKEEIEFKGKKIIRERIEKKWSMPKIITNDIGFQMMFGFDSPSKPSKTDAALIEYSTNQKI